MAARSDEYISGYLQALQDYAVYKDGSQFVGCGIYSLWEAGYRFLEQFSFSEETRIKILKQAGFRLPEERKDV